MKGVLELGQLRLRFSRTGRILSLVVFVLALVVLVADCGGQDKAADEQAAHRQ